MTLSQLVISLTERRLTSIDLLGSRMPIKRACIHNKSNELSLRAVALLAQRPASSVFCICSFEFTVYRI